MAEPVDQEVLKDTNKAFSVLFILAILASTGYFFYKFLDKQWRFFYITRTYIVTVLTAGDFFIAIFSMFVYARNTYEKNYRPGCSTQTCATVYSSSYFPFVYATGMICLCVELVFRHRIRAFFPKVEHSSLLMAGVPWLFGLVLVLPLTLAGMNWDSCQWDSDSRSPSRMRAIVWVCVVLPASLAVLICFIVKQTSFDVIPKGRYPGINRPPPPAHTPPQSGHADAEPNAYSYGDAPSQPSNPSAAPNDVPGTSYTSLDNVHAEAPAGEATVSLMATVEKEKLYNLIVALAFFVLSMPYALFTLGYSLNDDAEPLDPIPQRALERLFFWLAVARSAVLPLLWTIFLPKSPAMYVARA